MNVIYAFSKRIKDGKVAHQQISDSIDMNKIGQVIDKLEKLPRATKIRLDELQLRANAKEWANFLIRGYPDNANEKEMGYLLNDFTESMKTRMREESKYAIGLLMPNRLILCHSSFGEETVTPEWKTVHRMLDTDNVLRYVCFVNEDNIIFVRYWEREATSSFIEWLGLPNKAAFLFGGKYRIRCQIENITTEFQLTEQEMENWLRSHAEFKNGMIEFSSPIHLLSITEIIAGKKRYESPGDFIQDFEAEKQGIPRYQKEYDRINSEKLPMLLKYYDEKTQVVRIEEEEETTQVTKSTPGFDILFVNENIGFRESYLSDIVQRFMNSEPMKIVHVGVRFKTPSFIFENMNIYNEIKLDSLIEQLVAYCNETNLQDKNLTVLLKFAILARLAESNAKSPIYHFFAQLSQKIMGLISLEGKWTKLEGKFLEYKSGDILAGGNETIVNKLSEDILQKLKESACKIYFVGVEDDGIVNPLPVSRLRSDRIEAIRTALQDALDISTIYMCPIIREGKGLLLIMVHRPT